MKSQAMGILEVSSSGRFGDSATRRLQADTLAALADRYTDVHIVRRDLANGVPFVNNEWIDANFTPAEKRSDLQRQALSTSDHLIAELKAADVIVIGVPIYNFSIPAVLKAWLDQVARARVTFRYSDKGPVGLLTDKKAILVLASGGVGIDSATDFATPYLRHVLKFIGITDVEIVAADRMNSDPQAALQRAQQMLTNIA